MLKIKFRIIFEKELENDDVEEKKELALHPHFNELSKLAKILTVDDMIFYRLL